MAQYSHRTTPFEKRAFPLVLFCDGVQGPANIGSLFRICDAFGVSELIFNEADFDERSPRMRKTSRDTYKRVNWSQTTDPVKFLKQYREAGYTLVALEITTDSEDLNTFKWDRKEKIALVVGNEQYGVSDKVLSMVDHTLHIKMFGVNSSINVSHASAIALYHLTRG